MNAGLLSCLLWLFATNAFAHRLDELLQAIRVAVATNRIDLSLDLTPGVAVAKEVLAVLDVNRDGRISETEGTAHVRRILHDLDVHLDGKAVTFEPGKPVVPTLEELRSGAGVIRFKAYSTVGPLAAGDHTLTLTNRHLPAISVFLVNALRPADPLVAIARQTRNKSQAEYRLDFRVGSAAR